MRTDDDAREALDNAKVLKLETRQERRGPAAPDWPLLTYGDELQVRATPYLVKGLLNRGAFSAWYGKPKAGKSFVVLDLALHIAAGREWRGRRVKQGRVLYLALEGGTGLVNRLAAARTKFGHEPLPFHVLGVPLNLVNGDSDAQRLRAFIQAKAAELGDFDLIVLDTLSRAAAGGDENSPQTMTTLVGALDGLRDATGAHVLAVHHVPKSGEGGPRGHGSLLGAVDLAVEIADRTIRVSDARDGPSGDAWAFDLEPVELGQDEDGEPIVSCIVRESDRDPARRTTSRATAAKPLGGVEKVVLSIIDATLIDIGQPAAEAGAVARDIPRRATVVRREAIQAAAERYMADHDPEKPANKRREALNRALGSLQGRGLLMHVDGWFWRVSHDVA